MKIRTVLAAILTAGIFSLFVACTSPGDGISLSEIARRADETNVCVRNTRPVPMRVVLQDARTGTRHGQVSVAGIDQACAWINLRPDRPFNAVISAVSLPRDVLPPGWERLRIFNRGRSLTLVVGQDGLTPFAHSYRKP